MRHTLKKINLWASNPIETQDKVFKHLIDSAKHTTFGRDHHFSTIKNHEDFVKNVPVRDYENLKFYVDQVVTENQIYCGQANLFILLKLLGQPLVLNTFPSQRHPLKHKLKHHEMQFLVYINDTGNSGFVDGKWIFLQGSPVLNEKNGIKLGRLSGISAHYVPSYLLKNRMPTGKQIVLTIGNPKLMRLLKKHFKKI